MRRFVPRQQGPSSTEEFLRLISDPFQSQVQSKSIYAAIVYSFVVAAVLFAVFCLLRPRIPTVYAPRAKYADAKHAPLPLSKQPLGWVKAITAVKEPELVEKIGLDAVIFLRFTRMLRNIFLVLAILGLVILIPTVTTGTHTYASWDDIAVLLKLTPQYSFGEKFWAFVFVSYLIQGIICGFIYWNYRAVLRLKRAYFKSEDYQKSLHARTLLVTHVPDASRTDAGLAKLIEEVKPTENPPTAAIGRNVKELPRLMQEHDETVEKLEEVLAKYLANPNRLPPTRPTCKVFKSDRSRYGNAKVDAIDYLTERISRLAEEIQTIRDSVDQRHPMPYGFASFTRIEDAHAIAFAARKKAPKGSSIFLAPKPHDLLWQNLPMTRGRRTRRKILDGLWMILLTVIFVAPNILTAVFLSDLSHLGLVWPAFQTNLIQHPTRWAIVQGILAPLVQILIYLTLPPIFRRIYTHSGDESKTQRERHVTSRLYAFFVFNNLIVFSIFSSTWKLVASIVDKKDQGVWNAIRASQPFANITMGLCNISTFWLTWQMQRNLIAASDLLQIWTLITNSFQRKLMSPTPRQLIKLTAPQPFDYPVYYNNILYVGTVGLCIGVLQPVILPITAFWFTIEYWWKKYLLQYVFITKTESGGLFWVMITNRLLFATVLANAVIALVVGSQGVGNFAPETHGNMLYAMVPLPFLLAGFKWYCVKNFDVKINYYSTKVARDAEGGLPQRKQRNERVGVRFGHPALYKPLITPMVHAKAQHRLREVYHGKPDHKNEQSLPGLRHKPSTAFGDVYMAEMDHDAPGKPKDAGALPFETVNESEMDFQHFMRRAEFREEFGGDGELYGRADDMISSPGTTTISSFSKAGVPIGPTGSPYIRGSSNSPSSSRHSSRSRHVEEPGTTYAPGYQYAGALGDEDARDEFGHGRPQYAAYPSPARGSFSRERSAGGYSGLRDASPGPGMDGPAYAMGGALRSPYLDEEQEARMPLSSDIGVMGRSPVDGMPPAAPRNQQYYYERGGRPDEGFSSYDEFRRGRRM